MVQAIGLVLTGISLTNHVVRGGLDLLSGHRNAANKEFAWAAVDLLSFGFGPTIEGGSQLALNTGEIVIEVESLMRAGVNSAAIWGYLTTVMQVANGAGGGGGSSSGGGSSGGGSSGQWENVSESMSERAAKYQQQITGKSGQVYRLNGVKFDGFDGTKLLDAKGPGYSNFLDQNGQWQDWFRDTGMQDLLKQAESQVRAAGGRAVVWHVAEQDAATAMQQLVGPKGVQVVYTPAQ